MKDKWLTWLLEKRSGGNAEQKRKTYEGLRPFRDKVIENASIKAGETVLDVGTGDGLIAFGILEKHPDIGKLIFSDISQDSLEFCRDVINDMNASLEVEFINTPAEKLNLPDESVDVVTARSVYIYVKDKQTAFTEAHRVLKPGGRFSIFEPINRFRQDKKGEYDFFGMDLTAIKNIAEKFLKAYGYPMDPDENTMTDFDERDLLELANNAGFAHIKVQYEARYTTKGGFMPWDMLYNAAPNPNAPSLKEAFEQTLSQEEQETAEAFMKHTMETAHAQGGSAIAYLTAVK